MDYLLAGSVGSLRRISRDWNTKASSPRLGRFYVSRIVSSIVSPLIKIIHSRLYLQSITIDQYHITDSILEMCQHLTLEMLHVVETIGQVYRAFNFSFILFFHLIFQKHLFSQHHLVVKGLAYGVDSHCIC